MVVEKEYQSESLSMGMYPVVSLGGLMKWMSKWGILNYAAADDEGLR